MTCFKTRRNSTAYIDGRLRERERARLSAHLNSCDACASHVDQLVSLRSGLRSLTPAKVPANLESDLRVIASKERSVLVKTNGSRALRMWQSWKLRLDELMRP